MRPAVATSKRLILIEVDAWRAVIESRCMARESGGILLGCRHRGGVYVNQFIEVPDPQAHATRYRRLHRSASKALKAIIETLPQHSSLGYVGEWHTHSAPVGPSSFDRRQVRRISRRADAEIALVVAAHGPNSGEWTALGICAHRGRTRLATVEQTDLTPPDNVTETDQLWSPP